MHVGLVDLLWEGHHTPYVVHLSQYFVERGHHVTFVTDEAHPRLNELPDSENLTVRALELPTTDVNPREGLQYSVWEQVVRVRQLRHIFDVADQANIDVLQLLYFDRTQIPLWATTRFYAKDRPPIVATLHRDAFTDTRRGGWAKGLTEVAIRTALNTTLSDGSLTCLTVHADTIRDRIIESVPAATTGNIRTVPAPTPPLSVELSRKEAREHLDLPVADSIALFFGGLREEKGPDLLAEAARGLRRPLTIVFAGAGDDFTAEDVDEWEGRVEPPVHILDRVGFIPESILDYYFIAADVLVLPYRRQRGISGPLRRACAAGSPVIGNRESDIGAIIDRNELGWTFENDSPSSLRETLRTFLDESEQRPTDSLSQYAADHHWEETGRAIEAIFREVLDTAAQPLEAPPPPD